MSNPGRGSWTLRALAFPYAAAIRLRNGLYDRGWLVQRRLPCRVISIGNLTVGGTGKTPLVIWTVEQLMAKGLRVAVLSRGYRRQYSSRYVLVSDGRGTRVGPDEAGDEPFLIARRCPGAVVAVGADRYRLGRWVLERCEIDCIVLDDGFQHRGLHRDLDLLLIDATDPQGLRALLPAGRLREPLSSAGRATALIVTRADQVQDIRPVVAPIMESTRDGLEPILVRFVPDECVEVGSGVPKSRAELSGRKVFLFSGIANPSGFRQSVDELGVEVVGEMGFPDHHRYSAHHLAEMRRRAQQVGADCLLTTEKDAVKIAALCGSDVPTWALRLRTEVFEGRERLQNLLVSQGPAPVSAASGGRA
jgi:tetraacyldisaccharide 4'-kinase